MNNRYKITSSTELMNNYKQSELISPQKDFYAVQTDEGMALLFSIGTDNVFYLIEQQSGHSTGWRKTDLSSMLSSHHSDEQIKVKTFCAAQNISTQKIDIALVITAKGGDYLYVSLGNDNKTDSITQQSISWQAVPYDDPDHAGIPLEIAEVFIAESSREEYIVVDISQSTFKKNPNGYISRYYIDMIGKEKWNSMVIGGELEPGASSCLGRVAGDRVDGMYTLGTISNIKQLLYVPLYNPFDTHAPVTVRRLSVPEGAEAAAVCHAGDKATDLFVAAEEGLYYFASTKQEDGNSGTLVVANSLFSGASNLYALSQEGELVVWGLNKNTKQIFYTSCSGKPENPADWSLPIPIMSSTEQIAPYLNRENSANSFFAHVGTGKLMLAVQSPETTIWNSRPVTLPPLNPKVKADTFRSYTTRFQVIDENDQPVSGTVVNISSDTDTGVYINNLYYVIGTAPVQIKTDCMGTVTVIDAVASLAGAKLEAYIDNDISTSVNPMSNPSRRATQLQSPGDLSAAVIEYQDGSTKKLIKNGVSSDTLQAVAVANKQLADAYDHISTQASLKGRRRVTPKMMAMESSKSIWVEVGDLFSWLANEVEYIGKVIWNEAKKVWTFVVKIAGEIYSAVLDTIEAVAAAVQTVYNTVIDAIEDLIDFLKFLFDLKSIKRTKDVMENIARCFLEDQIDQIGVVKEKFDTMINDAEQAINNWADTGSLSGLGREGEATVDQSSKPTGHNSSSGALLLYHYQNNADNTQMLSVPPTPPKPESPSSILVSALEKEWSILGDTFGDIYSLAGDMGNMSAESFVKKLTAVIADATLESVKNVFDALMDVIYAMAETALEILDTPIYIPVVSDILEAFGVPKFSFLDIICWCGAIPVTIIYKLVKHKEPFQDNKETKALIDAKNFSELTAMFQQDQNTLQGRAKTEDTLIHISEPTADAVFTVCHAIAGVSGLFSAVLDSFEAAEETGDNPLVIPAAVSAIVGGGLQVGANILVPRCPIENTAINWINRASSATRVACKVIFSGPGQKFIDGRAVLGKLKVENSRGIGAIVDSVLVIPSLACSCWHFYELAKKDSSSHRTEAILDEVSNIAAYITRVSYAVAVNTEAEPKYIAIGFVAASDIAYGGLQAAESAV